MDQSPEPMPSSSVALKRGAVGAAILLILLIAGVLLLVRTRNAGDITLDSSSSRTTVAATSSAGDKNRPGIGGAIPDAGPGAPEGTGPHSTIVLDDQSSTTTSTVAPTTTTAKPVTNTVVTAPPPTNPPTTSAPPTTATPPTTSATAVRINSFTVGTPDCTNLQVKVSWNTTNAVRVTISIDGPGIFSEYNMNHPGMVENWADDFPFACSEDHHTYLITAYAADNSHVEQTIVRNR